MPEDVVVVPENQGGGGYKLPPSLIDAISDIQQYAVMESEGATDMPADYGTPRRLIAYFNIGFNYGIGDGLLLLIFAPFLYAVLMGILPIFGKNSLDLFDKIYVFLLSKYFSVGLFFLMIYVLTKAKGSVSRALAFSLVGGYSSACVLRVFVFAFLYRILYFKWNWVENFLYEKYQVFWQAGGTDLLGRLYSFLGFFFYKMFLLARTIKPVLITTSNYESIFHLVMLFAIGVMWFYFTQVRKAVKNPFYGRF